MTKIATWNVNSVRIRLEALAELAEIEKTDIICLQEVKAKEEDFPFDAIKALGYEYIALNSMAGYNGVAILSKSPLQKINKYDWCNKTDARHICATNIEGIEIHNIYIPAGGDIPDVNTNPSFVHKLQFVDELAAWFKTNKKNFDKLLVCGDFNIAPLENDVWDHKKMLKIISHTPIEIEKLTNLYKSVDFVDVMRKVYPEPQKLYTWWSYRNPNWQTNDKGRRLDHIWVNSKLENSIKELKILKEFRKGIRPSDHVPIVVKI